jgi:tRNA A58 N-methylase Trm61
MAQGGRLAVTISLEVPPGMESVVRQEAAEHGVPLLDCDRPGILRCPPTCPPWRLLPALRCVYGLVIEAAQGPPLRFEQPLEAAAGVAALISGSAELRQWRDWLEAEENLLRYRFSVERPRLRRDRFRHLLEVVRKACLPFDLFDSPSDYDVELNLHADAAGSCLCVRPSFMKDTRFLYRRRDVGAAIHPVVAACLARLSRATANGTVFDPTCGSATLLIERALLDRDIYLIGQDISRTAVAAARTNIEAAGLANRITLRRGDSTRLESWPACHEVLANLPFGMRTRHQDMDLPTLYRSILENLSLRLQPGGRAVCYTTNRTSFETALSPVLDRLRPEDRLCVQAGGLWVHAWTLRSERSAWSGTTPR